jgi:hypothetical protein
MADRIRNITFGLIALPLMLLGMSSWASAANIFVDTTAGGHVAGHCTLEDAVLSADNQSTPVGSTCVAGSGHFDGIFFLVTGTIFTNNTMVITYGESLTIEGPEYGGIIVDGGNNHRIIDAENSGTFDVLSLFSLTFTHGFALDGGAVYANGNYLAIAGSLFVSNTAQDSTGGKGGALFINSASVVDIVNSTFTGNQAVHGTTNSVGGAIADMNTSSGLYIEYSTIAYNSADAGGGYASMVSPLVKSTIFAGNTPHNCAVKTIVDEGFNVSTDASCGTSHENTDPLLDAAGLQNNGGPTETISLQSGSPAIDLIPVVDCTDVAGSPVVVDQRSYGRPDPANLNACDSGAYELDAVAPYTLNSEKVQIARSSSANSDEVNVALNFTSNGVPACDAAEDALNSGIYVSLFEGTCASIPSNGLELALLPFVVHTVNHQSYGTLLQEDPPVSLQQPSEIVSARMTALNTPAGTCGQWVLNLEVSGLATSYLGLGGSNPFALVLTDTDGHSAGCFDITDAVVGNQIPPPPIITVRRGVRRGVRR